MSVNFYKLMRRLQWGTHLGLAGGKRVKNKLTDILLMLVLCGLEEEVRGLARRSEATEGVYSWKEPGNIPHLSLYPQRTRYNPTSRAPYRLLERLQR